MTIKMTDAVKKNFVAILEPNAGIIITPMYSNDHHLRNETNKWLKVKVTVEILKEFSEPNEKVYEGINVGDSIPIFKEKERDAC
jgi:hypothetical protein